MYKKRGQAALEFLMTYGWAILSAIIVIGALGSYFYFNQGGSTSIFVNAPFYGLAAAADTTNVQLEITNKGGETLDAVTVNITGTGNSCTQQTLASMAGGVTETFTVPCAGLTSDSQFDGDIIVTYERPDSSLALTSTGSVSTPIV